MSATTKIAIPSWFVRVLDRSIVLFVRVMLLDTEVCISTTYVYLSKARVLEISMNDEHTFSKPCLVY